MLRREKAVGIADLKANLSRHLRGVRRGRPLTVLEHRTPIARLVPVRTQSDDFVLRKAARRFSDFKPSFRPSRKTDSLSVLLELRRDRA